MHPCAGTLDGNSCHRPRLLPPPLPLPQGRASPLVLLMVPGLDWELLREKRHLLPNITGRLGPPAVLEVGCLSTD
jgi:hypothetical protein